VPATIKGLGALFFHPSTDLAFMKRLSIWGQRHPWKARLLIGGGQILLLSNALLLGWLLYSWGVALPQWTTWGLGLGFMVAYWLYPAPGQPLGLWPFGRYAAQRLAHAVLLLTYAGGAAGSYNAYRWACLQPQAAPASRLITGAAARPPQWAVANPPSAELTPKADGQAAQPSEETQSKARLKERMSLASPAKIFLLGLAFLGLVACSTLITGLACHLGCSGLPGLAGVVIGLGAVGLVFFSFVLARAIEHGAKRKATPGPSAQPPVS
jgi:sterol desaturase/sphingolipid hydroxylase (fatty acid hydroxylase superfamily)